MPTEGLESDSTAARYARRTILKATGGAIAISGAVSHLSEVVTARTSPDLEKYVQPLPIPDVREPDGTRKGADYYDVPVVEFTDQLHPDLPATTPNYQRLTDQEFEARVEELWERYVDCDLCAYDCQVDRTPGETGACHVDDTAYVSSYSDPFTVNGNGYLTVNRIESTEECV